MRKFLILVVLILSGKIFSQDLKGAYIRAKSISGFTYSISVTVFSDPQQLINRPTIPIYFGDGQNSTFTLTGTVSSGGMVQKTYSGLHTYAGAGSYTVFYADSFRLAGIKNMVNSQVQKLTVLTTIIIQNNSANNPAAMLQVPFYAGPANPVVLNPACSDADGDSLSYEMVNCSGLNYYLPAGITLNSTNGLLSFLKDSAGLYAFSFKIKEWRKNSGGLYTLIATSQIDFLMDITNTIGIKEQDREKALRIYPNPVGDTLKMLLSKNGFGNFSVEIIDVFGNLVLKAEGRHPIQVSSLSKGLYFLRLFGENTPVETTVFIKD